ncbi:hypothetical protein LPJ61_000616 [Coemansia biformis]|uniref:glucan 1,4-alpha-glucosidase n=1 Tax=Coemansia biformis TaxID=1286918 RepID=A0A9W7YHJ8_9FUNG|nr:hypothetical protein LPJ61_000616 [Coemansia biformis]
MAGAMCASPSRAHPDYYYAWTRDAGLVMSEVLEWLGSAQNNTRKQLLLKTLDDYVGFSKHLQGLTGLTYGLGEAKFHMDGSPFRGSWCNPQTDGPAIRARTLIKYARYLAKHGRDVDTPYKVAIRDLDYVVDMWRTSVGCDIWEESRGRHYYTLTAQCQALQEGAQMAVAMGDAERAQRYTESARAIQVELLPRFWDSRRGYIVATLDHAGGIGSKRTNLDAQVLLAALHHGGVDRVGSPHMADTVLALLRTFEPLYAVNQVIRTVVSGQNVPIGVAVGRYPEDVYNGDGVSVGNPWSLITSAIAEYHYILALQFAAAGQARIDPGLARLVAWTRAFHGPEVSGFADALADVHTGSLLHSGRDEFRGLLHYLLASGDLYMARVCRHTADDHTMYEQWSRYTGYGRGAIHLTWSYAAHSSAQRQRTKLVEVLGLNA